MHAIYHSYSPRQSPSRRLIYLVETSTFTCPIGARFLPYSHPVASAACRMPTTSWVGSASSSDDSSPAVLAAGALRFLEAAAFLPDDAPKPDVSSPADWLAAS